MSQSLKATIYPVKDVAKAKAFYATLLGTEPYADAPYYVGFHVGDHEIGLDPHGHSQGMTGPISYLDVDDIAATLKTAVDAGAVIQQEPKDVGGGMLIARVKDEDGNVTGLRQSG
ncbi:MAG: VOC family protein [Candidatus Dormibacteria bacterium]